MIRGAKAVILDHEDNMLILYRSGTHPYAPHTPDLPGGKVEEEESMIDGLIREIKEEAGIVLRGNSPLLVSSHTEMDYFGYDYYLELYEIRFDERPIVLLGTEHEKLEWRPLVAARVFGELYSALLESYQRTRIKR